MSEATPIERLRASQLVRRQLADQFVHEIANLLRDARQMESWRQYDPAKASEINMRLVNVRARLETVCELATSIQAVNNICGDEAALVDLREQSKKDDAPPHNIVGYAGNE